MSLLREQDHIPVPADEGEERRPQASSDGGFRGYSVVMFALMIVCVLVVFRQKSAQDNELKVLLEKQQQSLEKQEQSLAHLQKVVASQERIQTHVNDEIGDLEGLVATLSSTVKSHINKDNAIPTPTRKPSPSSKPTPTRKPSPSSKPTPTRKPSPSSNPVPSKQPTPSKKPSPSNKLKNNGPVSVIESAPTKTKKTPHSECIVYSPFMTFWRNGNPSDAKISRALHGHLRMLACHTITDHSDLGYEHVIQVVNKNVGDILREHLDIPSHITFAYPDGKEHTPLSPNITTMRLDDDDFVDREHIITCCESRERNVVLYPAKFSYYDVVTERQANPLPNENLSIGLCVKPNDHGLHALARQHNAFGKEPGVTVKYVDKTMAYYVRHTGNDSGDQRINSGTEKKLFPNCPDYTENQELFDKLFAEHKMKH